jgi:DNA-binding LacI/PurR family transcriptional regulator
MAGVSVGTVSHVITGSVPVTEPLRRKVQAAIKRLDYHPNHIARSLKTSKTRTLGVIVPDLTISFFPQVIRGAEAAARKRGYTLIAVNSDDRADRQRELLSLLRSQRVEGILLAAAAGQGVGGQILQIIESGIPVVYMDRIPDLEEVDSVSGEDLHAASMAVEHLLAAGYSRIAIATGPLTLRNEQRRLDGYRHALGAAGIALDDGLVWEGNFQPVDVAAMCVRHLNDGARPDAILSTNGPTGLGVLRAFRECGLKTPEDIALVTFDELTVDELFTPSITTVVQPAYDIGFRAAEILLERIENGSGESFTVRLPATLRVRESSRRRV